MTPLADEVRVEQTSSGLVITRVVRQEELKIKYGYKFVEPDLTKFEEHLRELAAKGPEKFLRFDSEKVLGSLTFDTLASWIGRMCVELASAYYVEVVNRTPTRKLRALMRQRVQNRKRERAALRGRRTMVGRWGTIYEFRMAESSPPVVGSMHLMEDLSEES